MQQKRCAWVKADDQKMMDYHDFEYGRRKTDSTELFEKLCLECFQAGLSWRTVLYKREALRKAFYGFNIEKVAHLKAAEIFRLMQNPGIIRNRHKIKAVVRNAQCMIESGLDAVFEAYVYSFREGNSLSRDLKEKGFAFVGDTICESFLKSVGAIAAHEPGCFLFQ